MNAKEKARELVEKFLEIQSREYGCLMSIDEAKQCAIIAVDEILEIYRKNWEINNGYWESVRQEIEKL